MPAGSVEIWKRRTPAAQTGTKRTTAITDGALINVASLASGKITAVATSNPKVASM